MKTLFLFAGEPSGDKHGAGLMAAIKKEHPEAKLLGVGGPLMRREGIISFFKMEQFLSMGFLDVLTSIPRLLSLLRKVKKKILETNPDSVVLIDYAEFNLLLAKALRKGGYRGKICQYVSPSVWAWRSNRIKTMEKTLDLLLCILPFEPKYFAHTKLKAIYIGSPIRSHMKSHTYFPLELPEASHICAIFPGSRKTEIERNLPLVLDVAKQLLSSHPGLIFPISVAKTPFLPIIDTLLQEKGLDPLLFPLIPGERSYDLMRKADTACATSGTVTLELALHHVPTVVIFYIGKIDLWIARDILKISLPHFALANIIAGKTVFDELFGPHLSQDSLYQKLSSLIQNPSKRDACRLECEQIEHLIGHQDASARAAHHLIPPL